MLEHTQDTQEEHHEGGTLEVTIRELRRTGGRHRAVLVTASAHFHDRLRAGSHGRRQSWSGIRYLVNYDDDGVGTPPPGGSSGRPMNGKRKSGDTSSQAILQRKFPALGDRR